MAALTRGDTLHYILSSISRALTETVSVVELPGGWAVQLGQAAGGVDCPVAKVVTAHERQRSLPTVADARPLGAAQRAGNPYCL